MYLDFFNLNEPPFQTAKSDAFFFPAHSHETAGSYIDFLFHDSDGIGVITGEAGVGKTVVLDHIVQRRKDVAVVARMQQSDLTPTEFLLALCLQLNIEPKEISTTELVRGIEQFALRQHLRGAIFSIVVDDAHQLSRDVLDTIFTLAKPDKNGLSKVNVLLIGRPALSERLKTDPAMPRRQQLRFSYTLKPFTEDEIRRYVETHIQRAGATSKLRLQDNAFPMLFRFTGGVPGLLNVLAEQVLFEAYERHLLNPDAECVLAAAKKMDWPSYVDRGSSKHAAPDEASHKLPPVGAKLIVRNNGEVVGEHLLKKQRVLLGRHTEKDVLIADKRASREHAQIVRLNDEFYLHDLNSSNGTFLGKKRVQWHSLQNGDVFRIGGHEIEYVEHPDLAHNSLSSVV